VADVLVRGRRASTINADAGFATVVIHDFLSLRLSAHSGASSETKAVSAGQHNQDNRGNNYRRTATGAAALIVGDTFDSLGADLETKFGLKCSILQHTLRRLGKKCDEFVVLVLRGDSVEHVFVRK
jgi:hypothetical protein